ncbi:hypothetical protein [Prosthecobacter sp.]|jgi:hypothetical protein|uniref:hypothetical protein n=1 Tax=Prosthecobacter sp. TaxID=1965333 RepID=UPI003782F964
MKAAFDVLKERQIITVVMTRDSVCAGDDCDAPHEKSASTYSFLDPSVFAQAISNSYLPSISGSGHSWTCLLNGTKIAIIGTKDVRSLVRITPFAETNRVHFNYHSASG